MSTNLVATLGAPYSAIKTMNTTNGTIATTVAIGSTVASFDAITGASLPTGSVLTDAEAIAVDPGSNRLYFINGTSNNPAQDLCYIDLATNKAYRYTGYPLETNTNAGYNIDRMTFASDGYGYALTDNGQDLIRFSINSTTHLPVITSLGALSNDVNNGTADVLTANGGDLFADGSGKLYLLANNTTATIARMLYSINPTTKVATAMGLVKGLLTASNNAVAIDASGGLYIGGNYQSVYKADLTAMSGSVISSGTTNIWKTGDFSSCALPVLNPVLKASKTYRNTTDALNVNSGDVVEFTITVTNSGNLTATNVKLYDAIPAGAHYVPNSTVEDGIAVADASGGVMPFSVSGGQLISTKSNIAHGIVLPGSTNGTVIKFSVTTDPGVDICNQASIVYTKADGTTVSILTDGPNNNQDKTCFHSYPSWQVNKTYVNTTGRFFVLSGDPVQYTIEVINSGNSSSIGANLFDAIPTYAHYVANSTTLNGVAVADIGGAMPFSVPNGSPISSPGQLDGVIVPGDEALITFTVKTDPLVGVCNQATVIITDASGHTSNVVSDDPTTTPNPDITCFFSDGLLCDPCSTAVNNGAVGRIITAKVMPNPFREEINMQLQSNTTEQLNLRLIDFYGRTVFTSSQKIGAGYNSLHINVPAGLAPGIYVLELSSGNKRVLQKKLIKQ